MDNQREGELMSSENQKEAKPVPLEERWKDDVEEDTPTFIRISK